MLPTNDRNGQLFYLFIPNNKMGPITLYHFAFLLHANTDLMVEILAKKKENNKKYLLIILQCNIHTIEIFNQIFESNFSTQYCKFNPGSKTSVKHNNWNSPQKLSMHLLFMTFSPSTSFPEMGWLSKNLYWVIGNKNPSLHWYSFLYGCTLKN
jgi:hypothetical protein